MKRTRVWLLSVAAALLVAGPAMAYSWPILFGLPAIFGQEAARPKASKCATAKAVEDADSEFKDILVQVRETPTSNLIFGCGATEPSRRMPYADQKQSRCAATTCDDVRCDLLDDCLVTWRKLWQQGKYREAYDLAKCAVDAAPDSVEARHAFVVSQIVLAQRPNNPLRALANQYYSAKPDLRAAAQYTAGSGVRLDGDQAWSGVLPAGTLARDGDVATKATPLIGVDIDFECPLAQCPLTTFFEAIFGGCGEGKSNCAQSTRTTERQIERKLDAPVNFHFKDTSLGQIIVDLKTLTGVNVVPDMQALRAANVDLDMPLSISVDNVKLKSALNILLRDAKLGYVIKDQALQITTLEKAEGCCKEVASAEVQCVRGPVVESPPLQGPTVIYIIAQPGMPIPGMPVPGLAIPAAPAADVDDQLFVGALPPLPIQMPPSASRPLPPPYLAPPPPPIVSNDQRHLVIPVPALPPMPPQPALPRTLQVQAEHLEQAEYCEMRTMNLPGDVRITQNGRMVHLYSPNYEAQCERIQGTGHGQLVLEGNVRLSSRRHGQTMTINAQRVLLNVRDDQFVVEQAQGMESSRVNIAPVGYRTPALYDPAADRE